MKTRNIFFLAMAIITLMVVACSGGGGIASVAQVTSPDPTDTSVPTPTNEPTATLEPVAPTPTSAPEPDLSGFDVTDMEGLMQEVMKSPELMGCLSSSMSLSSIMGLIGGEPTNDEIEQILPCFTEDQIGSMLGGLTSLSNSRIPLGSGRSIVQFAAGS